MSDDLIKRLLHLDMHPESAPRQAAERIEYLEAQVTKLEGVIRAQDYDYGRAMSMVEELQAERDVAYARGIEDAAMVADDYAEHSRNQAEANTLAPVHEAVALRVSKGIRSRATLNREKGDE